MVKTFNTEDVQHEYKQSLNELSKDLWETYSAFANTIGGVITLGASENKDGCFDIKGVNNYEKQIDDFWSTITNTDKVTANILTDENIALIEVDGKTLIQIMVPEAEYHQKPIQIRRKREWIAYKRLGSGDRRATTEQLKYMYANSSTDIDDHRLPNFTIDDLNYADIESYRKEVSERLNDKRYLEMNVLDFLREIGVFKINRNIKNDEDRYSMTVGGLLFFGKSQSIRDHYSAFSLDYFRKNSSTSTHWIDRISSIDDDLNIYSFYKRVLTRISERIEEHFELDENMQRKAVRNDLIVAVRELLVNALMHAYYGSDTPIKITEYPDYYEFFNPGDMRVSERTFVIGGTSRTRNNVIALLFRKAGISEQAGSGGPRVFDVVNKLSLRVPDVMTDDETTIVRLWNKDIISTIELSETQSLIMDYLINHEFINRSKGKEILRLSSYQFNKTIKELMDMKLINQVGKSVNIRYELLQSTEAAVMSDKRLLRRLEDTIQERNSR